MKKHKPRYRIYKTGKRMPPLKESTRALHPVAAAVEDAGGVRFNKDCSLREHYHGVPLRYRRISGRPVDLLLEDVQRQVPQVQSVDHLHQALKKKGKRPMTEDEYYQDLYEKHLQENETIPF
jgi:hypothetical protein